MDSGLRRSDGSIPQPPKKNRCRHSNLIAAIPTPNRHSGASRNPQHRCQSQFDTRPLTVIPAQAGTSRIIANPSLTPAPSQPSFRRKLESRRVAFPIRWQDFIVIPTLAGIWTGSVSN